MAPEKLESFSRLGQASPPPKRDKYGTECVKVLLPAKLGRTFAADAIFFCISAAPRLCCGAVGSCRLASIHPRSASRKSAIVRWTTPNLSGHRWVSNLKVSRVLFGDRGSGFGACAGRERGLASDDLCA